MVRLVWSPDHASPRLLSSIVLVCLCGLQATRASDTSAPENSCGAQGSPPWLRPIQTWQPSGTPHRMMTALQQPSHVAPIAKCGGSARMVSAATSTSGKQQWWPGSTRKGAVPSVLARSPATATPWQPCIPGQFSSSGTLSATKSSRSSCCPRAANKCTGSAPCTAHLTAGQPHLATALACIYQGAQSVQGSGR